MRRRRLLAISAALAASMTVPTRAADLVVTELAARDEDAATSTTVKLTSAIDEEVAGLQFDFTVDPQIAELHEVTVGPAAVKAQKDLYVNRLDARTWRVMVAGFNQHVIPSGIVATIRLAGSAPGLPVRLDNPILSDPFGNPLPVRLVARGADGSSTVLAQPQSVAGMARKLIPVAAVLAVLVIFPMIWKPRNKRHCRSIRR